MFAWDSWFARFTMTQKITDYYFAISTDRMTEQHEETEEPYEFKLCVIIALCHVFLIVRISRCSFHLNRSTGPGASVQGSKSLSISPSGGEEWRFCLGCVARQSNRHCCFMTRKIRASLQQQQCENVEADTPSAYWKRAVYFPFLDHLLSEVNARAVSETLTGLISSTTSNTR